MDHPAYRVSETISPKLVSEYLEKKIGTVEKKLNALQDEHYSNAVLGASNGNAVPIAVDRLMDEQKVLKRLHRHVSGLVEHNQTWSDRHWFLPLQDQKELWEITDMLEWLSKKFLDDNKKAPDENKKGIESSPAEQDKVQDAWSETASEALQALKDEISGLVAKVSRLTQGFQANEDEVVVLKNEVETSKTAMNEMNDGLNLASESIEGLCGTLNNQRQQLAALQGENAVLVEKVEKVTNLESQIESMKNKEAVMEQTIHSLVQSVENLTARMGRGL
ncbi:hypothetical protein DM02DRAFT_657744 [Periconia macrospinosa]|uniref:Uncharacterized protein n=1 Tax=Periconia macrospinosa TaxID=97972 RepID=A0A2V1DIL2_9PLEO|nr:hypothetical protein DM02DRAFT_657744 [Periconia macrospinosa]